MTFAKRLANWAERKILWANADDFSLFGDISFLLLLDALHNRLGDCPGRLPRLLVSRLLLDARELLLRFRLGFRALL